MSLSSETSARPMGGDAQGSHGEREHGMKIHSMVRIGLALALGSSVSVTSVSADAREDPEHNIHHVLLISVDGLHQVDTEKFIKSHPRSTLADLAKGGVTFTNADSFTGPLALVSGG